MRLTLSKEAVAAIVTALRAAVCDALGISSDYFYNQADSQAEA